MAVRELTGCDSVEPMQSANNATEVLQSGGANSTAAGLRPGGEKGAAERACWAPEIHAVTGTGGHVTALDRNIPATCEVALSV